MSSVPVPTIAHHSLLVLLLQLALLLLLALSLGQLAAWFKMPAIVGELFAGVILGPSVLSHVLPDFADWLLPKQPGQMHLLDAVGQLGVLLLVGVTGMELKFDLVKRRGATAVRVSLAGLLLPLGLGVAVGFLLPSSLLPGGTDPTVFALFLGVALCVSAIPVIAKTLMDMNLLHREVGQLTLASGVIDDVIGWFLLSIVSAMATVGLTTGKIAAALLYPTGVVLFAVLVGRPAVRIALRAANRSPEAGPTVAVAALIVLLGSAATHAMGLEAVFGAFVCGVLIATSGELDREKLAPLRTTVLAFLAPVYFATAGIRMDLTALARPAVLAAACAVLAVAVLGKFAGAYIGAKLSGLGRWEALALGAGMNSRGVIEVIVAMVGLRLGILGPETYTIIILVAIVTSLMAPPILRAAMDRIEENAETEMGMGGGKPRDLTPSPPASV
ncbi:MULTISPECIES: cation:proton antiporter [unclassified Streptomyces]|uniref:cation:proton antiporter n=1 Tax=unclassified Streptomyces TaxID=2593676 RepID=UPI0022503A38|nr:cation:proton antiporter [Streptomyces sp. NBC_00047]MCX5611733.1 cation:proton antiporter [Streptomyces sp. NBC_00047]